MSNPAASSHAAETPEGGARRFPAWKKSTPRALVRKSAWPLLVAGTMFLWTIALCSIAFDRFNGFSLFGDDRGNMTQAVWSTAHGRPLEVTYGPTGEQMNRLGLHVDPILAALAPLWLVAPSPLTLIAVQVGAVALGALPVYWLGRLHLDSERAGALLAIVYLAYPWTTWAALDVFHPVVLAIPLFLYGVWFLDRDRLVPFAICAIAAAATGELMGITVAALGVWYAVARRRRRAGVGIAVAGAAWTVVAVYGVVPLFNEGQSLFFGAFGSVGGSPTGVIGTLFTDPGAIVQAMTDGRDLGYLLVLAAPLGGVFLLAPGLAAIAVPQLSVNLLSGFSATTSPYLHYVSAAVPFLIAATVLGLSRLSRDWRMVGVVCVLVLSLGSSVMIGPWTGVLSEPPTWWKRTVSADRAEALRRALDVVPAGAPVASTADLRARLAAREYLSSVPTIGRARWIVVDVGDSWIPREIGGASQRLVLHSFLQRIRDSADWRLVFRQSGVYVFRKIGP